MAFSIDWKAPPVPGADAMPQYCTDCRAAGRDHRIVEKSVGVTDQRSCWGPGIPTYKQQCTGCGAESGPMVSAAHVGGGW